MTREQQEAANIEAWSLVRDKLAGKREHYCGVFLNEEHGPAVLKDLAKFCRANDSCFDPDPRIHAALEGRREVWLRIQQFLRLSPDKLAELFGQPKPGDVA